MTCKSHSCGISKLDTKVFLSMCSFPFMYIAVNVISSPVPKLETRYHRPKIWGIPGGLLPAQSTSSRNNVCGPYRSSASGPDACSDHGREGRTGYLFQTSRRGIELRSIGSRLQLQRESELPTFIPPEGGMIVEPVIVDIIDKARIESYLLRGTNVVEMGRMLKTPQVVVILEPRHMGERGSRWGWVGRKVWRRDTS